MLCELVKTFDRIRSGLPSNRRPIEDDRFVTDETSPHLRWPVQVVFCQNESHRCHIEGLHCAWDLFNSPHRFSGTVPIRLTSVSFLFSDEIIPLFGATIVKEL